MTRTLSEPKGSQGLSGQSPLIIVAAEGHENVVKLLSVDVDGENDDGWFPLLHAAGAANNRHTYVLNLKGRAEERKDKG